MKIATKTDAGRVRTNNEDSILVDQERGIFLLADGMGGHNAGEVASNKGGRDNISVVIVKYD